METFRLEHFIEEFRPKMRKINSRAYRDLETMRAERNRLEAQKQYIREQEAEAAKARR